MPDQREMTLDYKLMELDILEDIQYLLDVPEELV